MFRPGLLKPLKLKNMLVTPKFNYDADHMIILDIIGQGGKPHELETGIFLSNSFSMGNFIDGNKNEWPDFEGEHIGSYGVCDSIEQVKEKYAKYFSHPTLKYCVSFTKVTRAEQPSEGGWRWHKWGEYIGDKNPRFEYLYDEKDIDEIYCYHVIQIL